MSLVEESMSTPAQNTRLKQRKLSGQSVNKGIIDSTAGRINEQTENKQMNEMTKGVNSANGGLKKKSIYRSVDSKKDALIQRWLATSQELDLNKSFEVAKTTKGGNQSWEADTSQASSEVVFRSENQLITETSKREKEDKSSTLSIPVTTLEGGQPTENMKSVGRPANKMQRMKQKLQHKSLHVQDDYEWQKQGSQELVNYNEDTELHSRKTLEVEHNEMQSIESFQHDHDEERENSVKQSSEEENESNNPKPDEKEPSDEDKDGKIAEKDVDILQTFKTRLESDDKTVFYDMFELLITKMSCIETTLAKVKEEQKGVNSKIANIENAMTVYEQEMNDIGDDIGEISDTNVKIVQATIKCDENFRIAAKKIKSLSRALYKSTYICYGLANKKADDAKETITKFLKERLKFKETEEIQITTAFMIGKKDHSPIVFQLQDPNDCRKIFYRLNETKPKNKKDRRIIIKEYLDEEDREEKKRHQDLINDNRNLPTSHQCTMKHQKQNLAINDEIYKKEIQPPMMKEVLLRTNTSNEDIFAKLSIHSAAMRSVNGSTFYSYAAQVDDFERIKSIYTAIKEEHLSSTHVMSGYRIFGTRYYNLQDYSNDGEHGGGKVILDAIRDAKIWNMCVFVVRYHEGPNLGRQRFQIIKELTEDAIASFPAALSYGTNFHDKELMTAFEKMDAERAKKFTSKP